MNAAADPQPLERAKAKAGIAIARYPAPPRGRGQGAAREYHEYKAEFTEDLEAILPMALVGAAIMAGCYELPPQNGLCYIAAVAPFARAAVRLEKSCVPFVGSKYVYPVPPPSAAPT